MTRIIPTLAALERNYDALFCDLWGCVHDGRAPFPEAVAALRAARARGVKVVLLTNAPRPKPAVLRQLDRLGLPHDCYDEVVSSGDAAQYALASGTVGHKVYHLGPEKDEAFFTEMAEDIPQGEPISRVPLDEAEGIVCTGLFDDLTETPDDYRATLLKAKMRGLKLLCANPDLVVDVGDKRLYCAGAIARVYEDMGGESLYFGKPYPPIYDLARRRLGALGASIADDAILAVGDGVATDIRGAVAEGLDCVFITGGISASAFGPDRDAPDQALLDAWLAEHELSVTAALAKLR